MKLLKHVWRSSALGAAIIATLSLTLSPSSPALRLAYGAEDEYDRLDGMGASAKKVNVIEWEGNLEIHVYPAGSLKSLALTIDRKTKDKPVMVIGYRFNDNPQKQLIRRAIIDGIALSDSFRAYRDPSAGDYDKVVITNNNLDKVLVAYKLEAKPTQLYPDGHPALVAQSSKAQTDAVRTPAAVHDDSSKLEQAKQDQKELQDSGSIRPFMMEGLRNGGSARNR